MNTSIKRPRGSWSNVPGSGEAVHWICDLFDHEGDECVFWPFSTTRGYGVFAYHGKNYYAHRAICEMVHGPAPTDKHHAAHSCGQGENKCVNPQHISWKTPSENQLDKREHGTPYRDGRRNKLKPEDVLTIRSLRGIKTQDEIATMFGVSRRNIGMIQTGRSWVKAPQ